MTETKQPETNILHIGIDVGSTTVKLAVLNDANEILWAVYRRHHADVRATVLEVLKEAAAQYPTQDFTVAITGSGGLLLSQWLGIEFVQEVIASKTAVETFIPQTDVAIELGGEDAKIIYFDNGIEQRMNGTCAGGTGAFIDQMAALLDTDASGLNELAESHTILYPIASRCGVFAKTDVQPLLNEGAKKEDIAASIFQSVVTQTISGLACGRPIRGNVAFWAVRCSTCLSYESASTTRSNWTKITLSCLITRIFSLRVAALSQVLVRRARTSSSFLPSSRA